MILPDNDPMIITPHIGSFALEVYVRMETASVENVLGGLKLA